VGPAPGGLGADRQAKGAGRACAKRYPRSGPFDLNRTKGIRPGKGRPRATLTGGPGHEARVREAVPAVRAMRSVSDGGDQTGEGTAAGGADRQARASGARARSGTRGPGRAI
jgi:hypothetical protein